MDEFTEPVEEPSFPERFKDLLCGFQAQLYYLFVIDVILLVLLVFPLRFVDPGTTPHVILQLNFVIIGATLVPVVAILYVCSRRK